MARIFYLFSRIANAVVALALALLLLGYSELHYYLFLGALLTAQDALTSKSLRGKVGDGLATIGLAALFVGAELGPLSGLVIGYAVLSLASNALASATMRQRFHTE